jgi:probable phosphoglycerate mutase
MDLGAWEGQTFEQVAARHPDLLEALRKGEALAFGETGETIPAFEERVFAAVDALAERLERGSALVATHGGVIDAVMGRYLGRAAGRRTYPIATNTSMTILEGEPGALRLMRFNDASHLGIEVGFLQRMKQDGLPVVTIARHGVTAANKQGRIQGQSCWGLDDDGRHQAEALARWYPRPDRLISSPLQRAAESAAAFGVPFTEDPALMEMAFGQWEGKGGGDFEADDLAARVFHGGEDLPRGYTGETFGEVAERMTGFMARLDPAPGRVTMVMSHGAAIRALIAGFHIRGNDINRDLGVPPNTSYTHLVVTPEGPVLADYALAPHLE